jgi:hypothetical protein
MGPFPKSLNPSRCQAVATKGAVKTKFFVNLPDNVEEIGENIEARIS